MIQLFISKSLGENKLVKLIKVLPASIKSMNPMHKYSHFIKLLYSQYVCFYVFMLNNFLNFFRSMFNSKTVKIINFIICFIQSNPMCTNICIFMKVLYICLNFYSFRQIIATLKLIKFELILIVLLYFKVC